MLDNAKTLRFDEFRLVVDQWEALADAAAPIAATTISPLPPRSARVDDGYTILGECGVAQGATMRNILERFCEAEFHADWDEARARFGDDQTITPSDLARTARQRRLDALHAIFLAAAARHPVARRPNRSSTSSSTKPPSKRH